MPGTSFLGPRREMTEWSVGREDCWLMDTVEGPKISVWVSVDMWLNWNRKVKHGEAMW